MPLSLDLIVQIAIKLPAVISGLMAIVERVKGAKGGEKKAAVLDSIPASVSLIELGLNRDLLNDDEVKHAIDAFIEAEHAVMKAKDAAEKVREALKAIVVRKQQLPA